MYKCVQHTLYCIIHLIDITWIYMCHKDDFANTAIGACLAAFPCTERLMSKSQHLQRQSWSKLVALRDRIKDIEMYSVTRVTKPRNPTSESVRPRATIFWTMCLNAKSETNTDYSEPGQTMCDATLIWTPTDELLLDNSRPISSQHSG